jgi:hypothetical protein
MPRIYRGSTNDLKFLLPICDNDADVQVESVTLFAKPYTGGTVFTRNLEVDGNFVSVHVPNWVFDGDEEGVINYEIEGRINGERFKVYRQSNYYLKEGKHRPGENPVPGDSVIGVLERTITENGTHVFFPYAFSTDPTNPDLWDKAVINVDVPDNTPNLIEEYVLITKADMGQTYELKPEEEGVDGYSKVTIEVENSECPITEIYDASDASRQILDGFIEMGKEIYVKGTITDIQRMRPDVGDARYTLDGIFGVYNGRYNDDGLGIAIGDWVIVRGFTNIYNGQAQFEAGSEIVEKRRDEGGSCNLEDKGVSPSMNDRDGNGVIVIEESEGFDGLSRVVIDPSIIYYEGYNKALENVDKPLVELYVTENGEYLPQRTITEEIPYLNMDGDDVFKLNVGCGLLEEAIEFTLKFRWNGWVTDDTISNIFGLEQSDWDDSTFAIREFGGNFGIKIGNFYQMFRSDSEWHTLKMGATENNETIYIEFDGERYETTGEETTFVRWSEPVYIGATNTGGEYFRNCKIDVQWIEYVGSNGKGRWTPINGGFAVDFNGEISENTDNLAGGYAIVCNEEVVTTEDALGFSKVVVDVPQNGGGDCNIQPQKVVELDGEFMGIYPDEGYNGIFETLVDAGKKAEEWREEGRNGVREKLKSIEITENGRYSAEDVIYVEYLKYNGGYHTDSISTYDINRIEVTFKAETSASINTQGQPFILGGSMWGLSESGEDNECARAIQYAFGRIVGYWEGKWTDAVGCMDGEWLTITLDENGMNVKYPTYERYCEYTHDNGKVNGGENIFPFIIGGQGRRAVGEDGNYTSNLLEDTQFRGLIKEVKINTNSMGEITYFPKNWGYGVWDRQIVSTGEYLSALEPTEGEVTMNGEWERKYGEGWKEINVNIVPAKNIYKETTYAWLMVNGQDTSDVLSSNFQIKLRDDTTISDVAPGYPGPGYDKQGPLLIVGSYQENNITRIDKLVYDAFSTYPNPDLIKYSPVIYFGEMYCNNVQAVSIDAFKHMVELRVVGPMVNLGESFKGEIILNFENCEYLFTHGIAYAAEDFIKSLYDFSKGPNKEGVTTSYIKFHKNTLWRHDEIRNWVTERGWTLIEE